MNTIYKYDLIIAERQTILMPEGAKVLHLAMQYHTPCLWATVDPSKMMQMRTILMVGTGNWYEVKEDMQHLGTIVDERSGYVWHFFELP